MIIIPLDLDTVYEFSDFDRDNYIGREDLQQTVNSLTKSELTDEEVSFICDRVSLKLLNLQNLLYYIKSERFTFFTHKLYIKKMGLIK